MNPTLVDSFQVGFLPRLAVAGMLLCLVVTSGAGASGIPYDRGIRQVRELVALQRFDDAEQRLTAMLRQYPDNPELLAYRGRVRLWNGEPAGASLDLKRSLARREDREVRRDLSAAATALRIARAEAHLVRGETAEAEQILQGLFDAQQERYRVGLLLGRTYTAAGTHARAADVYRTLQEEYPREYDIPLLLVRSLIRSARNEEAQQAVERLPAADHPSLHLARATVATSRKSYDEALEHYRKALNDNDNVAIRAEMDSVDMLLAFQKADEAVAAGNRGRAADILRPLYLQNKHTYDVAHRLGRLALERNDFAEAIVMYRHIMEQYPSDSDARRAYFDALFMGGRVEDARSFLATVTADTVEWQLRRARLLYREGRFAEAAAEYRKAEQAITDPAVAKELASAERAARLRMAARLFEEGKTAEAERMWQDLFDSGTERYESGVRLARLAQQRGDFARAAALYGELSRSYPADRDLRLSHVDALLASGNTAGAEHELATLAGEHSPLVSLRQARLLFRLKRYEESVQAFRTAGDTLEPTVPKEREAAENALALENAVALMRAGRLEEATALWNELFDSGRERYESGYHLGMAYLKQRQFDRAGAHFTGLAAEFPKDNGFYALAVESRILGRDIDQAATMVQGGTPTQREYLTTEREDLLYRVRPNYLMISGLVAGYDNDFETERDLYLTLSQRISRSTLVLNAGAVNRFGLDDSQFGAELFFPLGGSRQFTGDLALSFSPDARFLPETAFRGEVTYAGASLEYSLGYTRMNFKNDGVDILVLGALCFPTPTLSLNERVYVVPGKGTFSVLSTLHYEPNHRFRGYYSLGLGTASDRLGAQGDLTRFFTVSSRIGAEYRPTPIVSAGGELFSEYRQNLYTRYGTQLFVKYWW